MNNTDRFNVIKVSSLDAVGKIERITIEILFKIIVLYLSSDFKGKIMANHVPKLVHRRAHH